MENAINSVGNGAVQLDSRHKKTHILSFGANKYCLSRTKYKHQLIEYIIAFLALLHLVDRFVNNTVIR